MTATAAEIAQVRRWVDEPQPTTYTDSDIQGYIETYPALDERGEEPYSWDESTSPPSKLTNSAWIPTYDLHAAAADIWSEKAAALAPNFDFRVDGGQYSRSQAHEQALAQERHHRARRKARTVKLIPWPPPENTGARTWIGNLAEPN